MDLPIKRISENLSVDPSTVRRILALFDSTGTVDPEIYPDQQATNRRKLSEADQIFVLELILQRPGIYLREVQHELAVRGIEINASTICRFLHRCDFTRTKLKLVASQRSEDLRAKYVAEIAIYRPDMLVFIDETGSDRRDAIRRFGYSLRGYPCISKKLLSRGCHTSAISVLSSQGILDVQFVRGGVNYDKFLDFVEKSLIPHLLPFDGVNPNSVVVMDNAIIHHHAGVQELISSVGALLIYLPPYSPDLNPIEEAFSSVKSFVKANEQLVETTTDLENVLLTAFANITPEDCIGWYEHSGYGM